MATLSSSISIYRNNIGNTHSNETIPLDIFLDNIRNGHWQDIVLPIRLIEEKKERDKVKKRAPYVTLSGKFTERADDKLEKHSGFIGIDIDNVSDPEHMKEILCADPYVVAAFTSISGRGLCLIFKIEPSKHREAFQGIGEYLFKTYEVIIDPTSVNPSRARFVSYDPHLFVADNPQKFTQYPKEKPIKKIDKVIFTADDFGEILKQIVDRRINVTQDSYHIWIRLAFALVDKFGESGREYFHIVSQYSSKYEPRISDKQYDACLRHKSRGNEAHISTFYYYCKEAGVNLYTERTKLIAYSASQGKKAGLNAKQVAENLSKFEGIEGAEEIVQQVMDSGIELQEDSLLDQMEIWLRQHYELQRNEITRYIENHGEPLKLKDFNTIFVKGKKIFPKLNFELIDRLINSDFVTTYNPFIRYFNEIGLNAESARRIDLKSGPHLPINNIIELLKQHFPLVTKLFASIDTPDPDYCLYFGAKWLVGAISAIHGEHSPLMFILSGEKQNTGKTEWFRRLLPKELRSYYAESKLDAGKDDEILMTQKLLIMDDEMGGKSKKEVKRLKELTSKQTFSLREPYGRNNVDLNRLAVLCGTTNDNEILSDPTGNRRIIPIQVNAINHELYNSVDKSLLWAEVVELYRCGLRWRFDKTDVEYLGTSEAEFTQSNSEAELIMKYFRKGTECLTASEIKVIIEKQTNQRLSLDRIGRELKRLGYEQKHIRIDGSTKRVYLVETLLQANNNFDAVNSTIKGPKKDEDDDLPF